MTSREVDKSESERSESALRHAFEKFGKHSLRGPLEMDGFHWTKMWRSVAAGDMGTNLRSVLDIIFTKVKGRKLRKITFSQFRCAVQMVHDELGLSLVPSRKARDSSKSMSPELQQGQDMEAKNPPVGVNDIKIREEGRVPILEEEEEEKGEKKKEKQGKVNQENIARKTGVNSDSQLPNVYERLTNSKNFTGSHRFRFDRDGRGRGIRGRDYIRKGSGSVPGKYHGGTVHNLAVITDRGPCDRRGVPVSLRSERIRIQRVT